MKDYDLNDVKVGDLVAFVCIRRNVSGPERHSIQKGTIVKFTDSTAVIDCEDLGKSFRIVEAKDEYRNEEKLKKVALLKEYNAEANDDTAKDALGQELKIGDSVAYMDNIYIDSCDGFIKGTVTKLTTKFVEMDGYKRKSYEKVVRIKNGS